MAATLNVRKLADLYDIFVSMIPRNCLTYLYKLTDSWNYSLFLVILWRKKISEIKLLSSHVDIITAN